MYYFASDIHLGAGDEALARQTERNFVRWLDTIAHDAKAVYLLGDVFDFWFEYNHVVPKGFVRALGKLAELSDRGIKVVFFTGNHDMWVKDYLSKECGMEIHTSPEVVEIARQRIFLAHGDNMQIQGHYVLQFMNTVFRSKTLRWLFSWLVHPDWAMAFGRWWSGSSRKSHNREGLVYDERITRPLIEYARNYARKEQVDHFVFGHLHYPLDYREEGLHVVHLGCWHGQITYAVLSEDGDLRLKKF